MSPKANNLQTIKLITHLEHQILFRQHNCMQVFVRDYSHACVDWSKQAPLRASSANCRLLFPQIPATNVIPNFGHINNNTTMNSRQPETASSNPSAVAAADRSAQYNLPYRPAAAAAPPTTLSTAANNAVPNREAGAYTRGSGPPPAQISLLPPLNNTTGYIIDKATLNRRLPDGARQLITVYYVGYADGRIMNRALVPYFEILQHVSPRELEEFEGRVEEMIAENEREMEEDRRREVGELRRLEVERGVTTGRVTRGMRRRLGVGVEELEELGAMEVDDVEGGEVTAGLRRC